MSQNTTTPIILHRHSDSMRGSDADLLIHIHFPDFVNRIEDYEVRGGTHFYFLDGVATLKINRRKVTLIDESGDKPVVTVLATILKA